MILYNKGDPIKAVKTLGKDIVHVHVKDAKRTTQPGTWGEEVPLGQGEVNIPAYLEALGEIGYNGLLPIEREVGDQEARIRDIAAGAEFLRFAQGQKS